ncbi:hypothetical protein LOK46_06230 [Methylobacterium sp. NMS14P]|uniref:hypothetical protein n=1 Tax=Methylobacterium sp. NMS14P TaxID=2894310 RepID=UPI002358C9F7|nr:hypothetical protein [Methylobacterium sp. NMS14P]WCS26430.1 hypothetical protein LOK46_06230 [Methylobacterium sp. NMS14P]
MWYISGTAWCERAGVPRPRYHIAYADSEDGLNWTTGGRVAVAHAHPDEVAISRPCVVRDADMYRMWYSYRGDTFGYRIGFATSLDGTAWQRHDAEAGLTVSAEGWDSEAVAYPTVFDHNGSRYMLYCGNEYSKTGFGLAIQK